MPGGAGCRGKGCVWMLAKKKGCKLILENPHGGILGEARPHGHPAFMLGQMRGFSHRRGAAAPLPPHLCRKKKKQLLLSLVPAPAPCSEAGADFRWLSSENSFVLALRLQRLLRCALLLCLVSRSRSRLEPGARVACSQQANLALEGSRYDAAFPARPFPWGSIPPRPRAGAVSSAPCQWCRESRCGGRCCCGKRGTVQWQGKPAGFLEIKGWGEAIGSGAGRASTVPAALAAFSSAFAFFSHPGSALS